MNTEPLRDQPYGPILRHIDRVLERVLIGDGISKGGLFGRGVSPRLQGLIDLIGYDATKFSQVAELAFERKAQHAKQSEAAKEANLASQKARKWQDSRCEEAGIRFIEGLKSEPHLKTGLLIQEAANLQNSTEAKPYILRGLSLLAAKSYPGSDEAIRRIQEQR